MAGVKAGTLITAALGAVLVASLASAADPCATAELTPDSIVRLSAYPSYFFRPYPKSEAVAYIRATSKESEPLSNYRVDFNDPNDATRELAIPGVIDPVLTPDEKLMLIPIDFEGGGMTFHSVDYIEKKAAEQKANPNNPKITGRREPAYVDRELTGVYQSSGIVAQNGNETTYRVLVDKSELQRTGADGKPVLGADGKPELQLGVFVTRDYRVTQVPGGEPTVTPSGAMRRVCGNISNRLDTPILSKDGKRVGVYDRTSGTSKIFQVADDGKCKEVLDLGFPTGKIDFGFDGSQITFHVDNLGSNVGEFFSGVDAKMTKDVMLVDLGKPAADGTLTIASVRRLTTAGEAGTGSYYPAFRADGRIVYMRQTKDQFAFHLVDPKRTTAIRNSNIVLGPCNTEPPREYQSLIELGNLWTKHCLGQSPENPSEAALVPLGLDPEDCKKLVLEKWKAGSGLTQADLLAACPVTGPAAGPAPKTVGKGGNVTRDPQTIFNANCSGCHDSGEGPPLDFKTMTPEQAREAIGRLRINDPRQTAPPGEQRRGMPLGNRLSTEDVDTMYAALRDIITPPKP